MAVDGADGLTVAGLVLVAVAAWLVAGWAGLALLAGLVLVASGLWRASRN